MTRLDARECRHAWGPMVGGYRYECSRCRAVGIRRPDGEIRAYSDGGRLLRSDQARAAQDDADWRRREIDQDREAREESA